MKDLWLEVDVSLSDAQKTKLLKSAAQICDVMLVDEQDVAQAKSFGVKVASSSPEADIVVLSVLDSEKVKALKVNGRTVAVKMAIEGKKDEETAIVAAELSCDYVIVDTPDWKIIPLENLIAKTRGKTKLLAEVSSIKEAKVALETLELGSDGVVLKTFSLDELKQTAEFTKKEALALELVTVEVVGLKEIGTGARACIDTCELMKAWRGNAFGLSDLLHCFWFKLRFMKAHT